MDIACLAARANFETFLDPPGHRLPSREEVILEPFEAPVDIACLA